MNDLSIAMDEIAALPTAALVALGVLYVVQVVLQVYALIDLYKTPVERILTGHKWVWVLVILFVNLVGAIVYLAAGKKPVQAVDPARQAAGLAASSVSGADRAAAAADLLYGTKGEQ